MGRCAAGPRRPRHRRAQRRHRAVRRRHRQLDRGRPAPGAHISRRGAGKGQPVRPGHAEPGRQQQAGRAPAHTSSCHRVDILNKILAVKADSGRRQKHRNLAGLPASRGRRQARQGLRGFETSLRQSSPAAPPASPSEEASPSKGVLRADFRPAEIAASYAANGAACLSVLTDEQFFQGSVAYLKQSARRLRHSVLRRTSWSTCTRSTRRAPWAPTASC